MDIGGVTFSEVDAIAKQYGQVSSGDPVDVQEGAIYAFAQVRGSRQLTRTEVMSDIFNAIKRKQVDLPRWEEFEDPFADDMLNIFSEYNNTLRMTMYSHRPDRPDDTFHSVLYLFLVSMIMIPRPDIISPIREIAGIGPVRSNYKGPVDQG
jgi:hypothetical protein